MKSSFADQELSPKALESLLTTLSLVRQGDFSARMSADGDGTEREVADVLNGLTGLLADLTKEFERVAESVTQGELRARVPLDRANGGWGQQLRAVNNILAVFGKHASEIRRVIKSVHTGDLARLVALGPDSIHRGGELARLGEDMNAMISHVDRLTSEITRVFAEVGLDGRLNAQCHLSDASGSWALLVGSVNAASASLSEQVQDLCETASAIQQGNLSARASVTSRGDLQTLKLGLNGAAEGMFGLCAELRRIAQEVVTEGKLSVEMQHPNPRGEWQVTQDACNRMWATTAQALRGAADVAERMLRGEATTTDTPPLPGELGLVTKHLAGLAEQDQRILRGLDGLAEGRFELTGDGQSPRDVALRRASTRLKEEWLRGSRVHVLEARDTSADPESFARLALTAIARGVDAAVGAYHVRRADGNFTRVANFGWDAAPEGERVTRVGEGLVGRAAASGEPIVLEDLDQHGVRIRSSLFELVPRSVVIFPVQSDSGVICVLELGFVRGDSRAACELLAFIAPDLARGARPVMQLEATAPRDLVRALEEDLLIASARLENLTHELEERDRSLRELQLELQRVRGVVSQVPGEALVPGAHST